jgi:hypothetical protein
MQTREQKPAEVIESNPSTIPGRNGGTLRPWRKGQSGNPEGMKPGTQQFRTILNRVLNEPITVNINGQNFTMTRSEAIVYELVRMATNNDIHDAVKLRAITELIDRIDGKPTPVLPDVGGESQSETVIFYIPNEHSRLKIPSGQ